LFNRPLPFEEFEAYAQAQGAPRAARPRRTAEAPAAG
jgi:hypothetical protein